MKKLIKRIEIIRATVVANKDVFVGEVLTVPDDCTQNEANLLVSLRKAKPIYEPNDSDIVQAIAELDPDDADLWTNDHKPQTSALKAILGFDISAKQRDAAFAIYQQQSEK